MPYDAGPGPARQAGLRDHNLGLVLRHVADASGQPSRADVATATGLTRATVSTLVDALVGGGLLRELPPGPRAGAGRPAYGLTLSRDRVAGLGLELNVDYAVACVVDLAGEVRHRQVRARDQRGTSPARAFRSLAQLARSVRQAAEAEGLEVAGAAVALPGLAHAPDGPLRLAPNLGWRDVDVVALLRREPALADLPLAVDNEANLAALAELYAGGPIGDRSFLYVSGEIGVGAGLVLDGALFRGQHGWGGEIGHVPVRADGPRCSCGSVGCLEQVAGQEAILRRAGLPATTATSTGSLPAPSRLLDAAARGDDRLLVALDEAGRALGLAAASVLNVADVGAVVLGGLYGALAEWVLPPVRAEVERRVLSHAWSPVDVRVSRLASDAAVLGAARSVVRGVVADPGPTLRAGLSSPIRDFPLIGA